MQGDCFQIDSWLSLDDHAPGSSGRNRDARNDLQPVQADPAMAVLSRAFRYQIKESKVVLPPQSVVSYCLRWHQYLMV